MAVGLTTRYAVRCDVHGQVHTALGPEKVVFVPAPRHKTDKKYGGCPLCKKANNQ